MPIYVYTCPKCGAKLEKKEPYNSRVAKCPDCKVDMRRVIQPSGIVFKF